MNRYNSPLHLSLFRASLSSTSTNIIRTLPWSHWELLNFESFWFALHLSTMKIHQLWITRTLWNLREIRTLMSQRDIELVLVANSNKSVFVLHAQARTFLRSESNVFDTDVIDKGTVLFYMVVIERKRESRKAFYAFSRVEFSRNNKFKSLIVSCEQKSMMKVPRPGEKLSLIRSAKCREINGEM